MGGKEALAGYTLQSLVTLLSALQRNDWDALVLEPDNTLCKVDIQIWSGDAVEVYQVKSSINDFTKKESISVLSDLISQIPNASKFVLRLLGHCSSGTRKYLRHLEFAQQEELHKLFPHIPFDVDLTGKILVDFSSNDIEMTLGLISNELHRFLSKRGYVIKHGFIDMITNSMFSDFTFMATKGQKMSKIEFEKKIITLVDLEYPDYFDFAEGELALKFYNPTSMEVSSSAIFMTKFPNLNEMFFFKEKINMLRDLVNKISVIILPPKEADKKFDDLNKQISYFMKIGLESVFGDRSYGGFAEDDISIIRRNIACLLNINLADDFFYVGNLLISKHQIETFPSSWEQAYHGTYDEKNKQILLVRLFYLAEECNDLYNSWQKLREFSIVPIVLINNSTRLHENIVLQFGFTEDVALLTADNFPYPEQSSNLELYARENGLMEEFCSHIRDIFVKEYDLRIDRMIDYKIPSFFERNPTEIHDHLRFILERLFDYKRIRGKLGKSHFECLFGKIMPTDKMGLPSYLVVKNSESFDMEYSICSNQCGVFTGKLNIPTNS